MDRTLLKCGTALCALLAASAVDAEIYRCTDASGTRFQDWPCGQDDAVKERVIVEDSRSLKVDPDDQDAELAAWLERAEADSRRRELEIRLQVLERENAQTQAEFAAMVEELDEQKKGAAELRAENPPEWAIRQREQEIAKEYAARLEENAAERKLAREALQEQQ